MFLPTFLNPQGTGHIQFDEATDPAVTNAQGFGALRGWGDMDHV